MFVLLFASVERLNLYGITEYLKTIMKYSSFILIKYDTFQYTFSTVVIQ